MTTILILGGYGFTGRLLARHLLEQSDARLVLAGRHLERAKEYADQLNGAVPGDRVAAAQADASDTRSLRQALENTDLLLVASPTTRFAESVIRAALECGVDYLDVQLGAEKYAILKSYAEEIARAGRCFITEAGFHPGLPSALIRFAAARLERVEKAITAGYINMGRGLPYSEAVDELMESFRDYQALIFKDGRWESPGWFELRTVDFGGEIGARRCYAMFFEELRKMPELYPSLKEVGFYISGSHWLVDWVIFPLAIASLKIARRAAIHLAGRTVWWGMQALPEPPYLIALKVEASGEMDGRPARFEATVSHPDGYELTAIPVAACLLQYLDGSARRPGLWMMGHLVDPERLLVDMERMGVRVSTSQVGEA